jgi:hypothetical protein
MNRPCAFVTVVPFGVMLRCYIIFFSSKTKSLFYSNNLSWLMTKKNIEIDLKCTTVQTTASGLQEYILLTF